MATSTTRTRKTTTPEPPAPGASLAKIMAAATPAERIVHVCVAGGLVAEYQALEQELDAAHEADLSSNKLVHSSRAKPIAKRMEKIAEAMRADTYAFRFRAMSSKGWSDLVAAHPAREGQRERFNAESFPSALIAACCVSPEGMDSVEAVDALLEVLNPAQRSDLFDGAFGVNNEAVNVPFSATASAVLSASEPSSTTASRSDSPAPSSSDGS